MDALCQSGSTALISVFRFIQTIGFVELRQSMELVGVHHVEVVAAILLFVLLQFTKFTAVLLIACLIAFSIFYMLEAWFPEIREGNQYSQGTDTYGGGYGPSYGPSSEPSYETSYEPSYETKTNLDYGNRYSDRDERTSAHFPPFNNDSYESKDVSRGFTPAIRDDEPSTTNVINNRMPSISGSATPVGYRGSSYNVRPQRRPYPNHFDEYRRHPMERDNHLFRKMIANDYRLYRPGTATEHQRHTSSNADDQRLRRPTSTPDESRNNRRNTDNKTAPQRKPNATEQSDRLRHEQRKSRYSHGTSDRSGGTYNARYDPAASHNNSDNRGAKRRSGLNLMVGTFDMDKVDAATSTKKDKKTPNKQEKSKCACDEDATSSNSKSDIEIPAIKSNGSYPYVIEMVSESSSMLIITEQADKSDLKK